jgi:pimeloyl-ACP methyl ester carboxylesterase
VAVGLGALILASSDFQGATPIAPVDCDGLEAASRQVTCFEVPVEGSTLGVVVIHDDGALERAPILVLPELPGEIPSADLDRYAASPLADDHDIVLVDPRGAGRSGPVLDCPDLELDPGSLDLLERCREDLIDTDADLIGPGMDTTVSDLELLRETLAEGRPWRRWHVIGSGYGSQVAHRLAQVHPRGIETLILASPVPADVPSVTAPASAFATALNGVTALCEQDRGCDRLGSTTAAAFRIGQRLDTSPEPLEIPRLDGTDRGDVVSFDGSAARATIWRAMRDESLIRLLPWTLHRIDRSASEFGMERYGRQTLAALAAATERRPTVSEPLFWTLVCSEQLPASDPGILAELVAATPELIAPLEPEAACDIWNLPQAIPPALEGRVRAPTMVLSSPTDPASLAEWGTQIASSVDGAILVSRSSQGWSVVDGSCDPQLVSAFIEDPSAVADIGCIDQRLGFVTRPVPVDGASFQSVADELGPVALLVAGTLTALGFAAWCLTGPAVVARGLWAIGAALLAVYVLAITIILSTADEGGRLIAQPESTWPIFVLPWGVAAILVVAGGSSAKAAFDARLRSPWPARHLVVGFGVALALVGAALAGLVPGL